MTDAIFSSCSEVRNDPIVVISEKGRKFTIINTQRETIVKIRVDGCLINDERKRCDFLFEIGSECYCAIYVELKGSNVGRAFEQLTSTLDCICHRHSNHKIICHIVSSRSPRLGTEIQNMKLSMARKYKSLLHIGTTSVSINIDKHPYCITN